MTKTVSIIGSKSANITSIRNAFSYLGIDSIVTTSEEIIANSTHIILPGVGAFDACIDDLNNLSLVPALKNAVLEKSTPILGICVGMQVLFEGSKEGSRNGLGLLKGKCTSLKPNFDQMYKVPHTGFAEVHFSKNSRLNKGLRPKEYFYFNHSYGVLKIQETKIVDWVRHTENFVASFQWRNIFGIQFHPEKSQLAGLKVLSNFVNDDSKIS